LNKQRYLEKKEFERNLRKLRKRVEDIENEIEEIENKIAEMDTKLSEPGNEALFSEEFFSRYNELKEKLSNKIALWEQYNIELDSFLKSN